MAELSSVKLVGNSLALLVAAYELVRKGRAVTMFTDGKPLGGHFAGARIGGHQFDLGMVMLERPQTVAAPVSGPIDYRAQVRNDWTRFAGEVAEWMDANHALQRVPTPTVRVGGQDAPDYLIANRLDLLAGASFDALARLDPADERHARNKVNSAAYDTLSYEEAAHLHHGVEWHAQCVEPFVRKLLSVGSGDILARYHRAAWAPLYYPETLLAASRAPAGAAPVLAEYPFYTTRSGFVGDVVADMVRAVSESPQGRIVRDPLQEMRHFQGRWQLRCNDEDHVSSWIGVGLTLDRCIDLLQLPPQDSRLPSASVALMFALVRSRDIGKALGCHMVVDEPFSTYRVCDQDHLAGLDPEWHRVVVEANPTSLRAQAASDAPAALHAVLVRELCLLMGLPSSQSVQVLRQSTAHNALVLPTTEAIDTFRTHASVLADAMPCVSLTGTLLGYGVASFNDQIVQGLQISKEFT